jgi:hypothetical protein
MSNLKGGKGYRQKLVDTALNFFVPSHAHLGVKVMDTENIQQQIDKITVSIIAIRVVVARLLGHEASRYSDPNDLFRAISEGIEEMLSRHSKGLPVMDLEEGVRNEIDWFVAAARSVL